MSAHLVDAFKCSKCGFLNEREPSNGSCSALMGCGFEKGNYEKVQVALQTIRSMEHQKAESEASNAAWAVIWLGHAAIVFLKKGAGYGFGSLLFGPLVWLF